MVFSSSSKDIGVRIDWSARDVVLHARCRKNNGDWVYSEFALSPHLGWSNVNRGWDWTAGAVLGLYYEAELHTIQIRGAVIIATVRKLDWLGEPGGARASNCLDFWITNVDGVLTFDPPPNKIVTRCVARLTTDGFGRLSAFCVGSDGKLHLARLDLNDHLVNDDGLIKRKKNGRFAYSARNIWLDDYWHLRAELRRWQKGSDEGHQWTRIDYDFCQFMSVDLARGSLQMEDPYGLWDLRGPFFRFLEDLPVVGYVVALVDLAAHDPDEAKRAAAQCTYTTLCLAGAIVGSAFLGPLGAAIGGTVANIAGWYCKVKIGQAINDPKMRNEVTVITIHQILLSEFFILAGAGVGSVSGAFSKLIEDELLASGVDGFLRKMGKFLGDKGLSQLTNADLKLIVNNLHTAIEKGYSQDDIKHMFGDYDHDGQDIFEPPKSRQPPQRRRGGDGGGPILLEEHRVHGSSGGSPPFPTESTGPVTFTGQGGVTAMGGGPDGEETE